MERLQSRFLKAHTQVIGVSIDSVFAHANWAASLGGVSFPLAADFHPKGDVAKSYGAYLEQAGITDRATVVIDASGVVRYAESVGPPAERNIEELAGICEKVDQEFSGKVEDADASESSLQGATLFVKAECGPSRAATLACVNLRMGDRVKVRNISESQDTQAALVESTGKDQAPCLVTKDGTIHESDAIIRFLLEQCPSKSLG